MAQIRIRTKFMLATLLITLLPVVPLYFLIDKFYHSSIEVGLNPQVEQALEGATELSQLLFGQYKKEILAIVEMQARAPETAQAFARAGQTQLRAPQKSEALPAFDIRAFDRDGNFAGVYRSNEEFAPTLTLSELANLLALEKPAIIPQARSPEIIMAAASLPEKNGVVIVCARTNQSFAQSSQQIVEVNQMFKTINLLRDDLRRGFVVAFFIVYVPIAVLSLLAGYLFAQKITAPLQRLVTGTQRIAAGDWQHRVDYGSNDELGDLVGAFNQMVQEVKRKQDQVIRLEKMAVWREMARVLAHEIKNPLTPIQLTVQQLKDKYSEENSAYKKLLHECTEIINDEIGNLQQLVREFSDFARLPKLHKSPGDLNELIAETARRYTDVDVTFRADPQVPALHLDFEKLRRVLINFFDNSRHSILEKGSGAITISTQKTGDAVLLRFSDTGAGIPDAAIAKIFEPHFSTKKSGMGLGLAIVRKIVEEHGGSIACESRFGHGATFEIRLPITAPAENVESTNSIESR